MLFKNIITINPLSEYVLSEMCFNNKQSTIQMKEIEFYLELSFGLKDDSSGLLSSSTLFTETLMSADNVSNPLVFLHSQK